MSRVFDIWVYIIYLKKQIKIRGDQELKNDALRQSWRPLKRKEKRHQCEDKCEDQLMLQSSVECNVDVDLMNELYEVCEWWQGNTSLSLTCLLMSWQGYFSASDQTADVVTPSTSLPVGYSWHQVSWWWHHVHLYLLTTDDTGCQLFWAAQFSEKSKVISRAHYLQTRIKLN